ncbi:MAG: hypothetical protein ABIF71_02915 [Planctomycetota bacterium]
MIDGFHLAMAVTYEMDYMLTWNCRHFGNGRVKSLLHTYNLEHGLHYPIIVTPEELIPYDRETKDE